MESTIISYCKIVPAPAIFSHDLDIQLEVPKVKSVSSSCMYVRTCCFVWWSVDGGAFWEGEARFDGRYAATKEGDGNDALPILSVRYNSAIIVLLTRRPRVNAHLVSPPYFLRTVSANELRLCLLCAPVFFCFFVGGRLGQRT